MDTELVTRLRAVIPRLARVLNDTSTGEDLGTPSWHGNGNPRHFYTGRQFQIKSVGE